MICETSRLDNHIESLVLEDHKESVGSAALFTKIGIAKWQEPDKTDLNSKSLKYSQMILQISVKAVSRLCTSKYPVLFS